MSDVRIAAAAPPSDPDIRRLRRARLAVSLTFAVNGFLMGAWVPRIPEVKSHLGLSSAALGLALLAPAVGSIVAMRLVGGWCARFGTRTVVRWISLTFCGSAWLPGVAQNLPELWLALLVLGASIGGLDVAMNAQGVTVEAAYRRPVLSGFHATWSIGSFTGALIGGLGVALHVPIAIQQAVLGALCIAILLVVLAQMLPDPPPTEISEPGRRRRVPELRLILIGVACLFALMTEGAVADWSGVLLRDNLHAAAAQIGFAFAAFSITMTFGRLVGDRVVHALGRAPCIAALSLFGAAGLAVGLATNVLVGVIIGFAALGLGLSIMVPVLFSTAADGGGPSGPAIATVSTIGYSGFLFGPSAIGLVAQGAGVPFALWMLPFFTLIGGVLGVIAVRMTAALRERALAADPATTR